MAQVAIPLAVSLVTYAFSRIAQSLLTDNSSTPIQDTRPKTLSERGTFIPLVIGRDKLGSNIGWVGNWYTQEENAGSGGKGFGGGGNADKQLVYYESGWHRIAVGGAKVKLHSIVENGEVTYLPDNPLSNDPTDPGYTPSGSTITIPNSGDLVVYWGEYDQPANIYLGDVTRVGIGSSWPYCIYFLWQNKRLGGFHLWPLIEYELEVHPYKESGQESRIPNVPDWFRAGVGPGDYAGDITFAVDGLDLNGSPAFLDFRIQGDVTTEFATATSVRIEGQPEQSANGDFALELVSFDTTIPAPLHGALVYPASNAEGTIGSGCHVGWKMTDSGTFVWNGDSHPTQTGLGGNTLAPVEITINNTGQGVWPSLPPGYPLQSMYQCYTSNINGKAGSIAQYPTASGEYLGAAWTYVEIYVCGVGPDTFGLKEVDKVQVIIHAYTGPGAYTNHPVVYNWVGGGFVITNSNGAYGTAENVGVDSNTGSVWWKLKIYYTATSGSIPNDNTTKLAAFLIWSNSDGVSDVCALYAYIHHYTDTGPTYRTRFIYYDNGIAPLIGSTLIRVTSPPIIPDVQWGEGAITPLLPGFGDEGANAATIIHQLLFAPYPHGRGLDETKWDITTFQVVGGALGEDGEALRAHIKIEAGTTIDSVLPNVLIDLSCQIVFDTDTGKLGLKLLREVDPADIVVITDNDIIPPTPEELTSLNARNPSRVTYSYLDKNVGYKENTVPVDDDGVASSSIGRTNESAKLFIPRDKVVAKKIAIRRSKERIASHGARKIFTGSALRDIPLGSYVNIPNNTANLVLMSKSIDTDSATIEGQFILDVYGIAEPEIPDQSSIHISRGEPLANDLAVGVFEKPLLDTIGRPAIEVVRIRANRQITGSTLYLSLDNSTYTQQEAEPPYVGGAKLFEPLFADSRVPQMEIGPVLEMFGEDLPYIVRTLTEEEAWIGKQVMRIGEEKMFVREFQAVGVNKYRALGITRAVHGTRILDHDPGAIVYVYLEGRVAVYSGIGVKGDTVYVKTRPRVGRRVVSLDSSPAIQRNLTHTELQTLPVSNLSVNDETNQYSTGEDVNIFWSHSHTTAINNRDSAGAEVYGNATVQTTYMEYSYEVAMVDSTEITQHTITVSGHTATFMNSEILAFLGLEETFTVRVTAQGKRPSVYREVEVQYV